MNDTPLDPIYTVSTDTLADWRDRSWREAARATRELARAEPSHKTMLAGEADSSLAYWRRLHEEYQRRAELTARVGHDCYSPDCDLFPSGREHGDES